MTAMTRLEASTSTNGKADASRTAYCPDVPAIDDPSTLLFDFMSEAYLRAVQSLPVLGAVQWKRGGMMTALSYDYYGTETHYQTIMIYNGFWDQSKIPPGTTINIPNVSGLRAKLQESRRGQVTRI
jgi:nucleoid-associated protein YgaU